MKTLVLLLTALLYLGTFVLAQIACFQPSIPFHMSYYGSSSFICFISAVPMTGLFFFLKKDEK